MINDSPEYFSTNTPGIIHQYDVYRLARYLSDTENIEHIVDIGSGTGSKLSQFSKNKKLTLIDYGLNITAIDPSLNSFADVTVTSHNLEYPMEYKPSPNSIIICADVIENLINPIPLLTYLLEVRNTVKYVLLSTPERISVRGADHTGPPPNKCHVREWSYEEFLELLEIHGAKRNEILYGLTINNNINREKKTILCILGKNVNRNIVYPTKSCLAVIHTYNEADILPEVLSHLLNNGIDVHICNNWSTDSTEELVHSFIEKYPNRVYYEKFPDISSDHYEWAKQLARTEVIASTSSYEWVTHYDSDEIRKSPFDDLTLQEFISFVDHLGYNMIDMTVVDFRFIKDAMIEFEKSNLFFEFGKRPGHFKQTKTWKNIGSVNLVCSGGHHCAYTTVGSIPYGIKLLNKHYQFRNSLQMKDKLFKYRLPRIVKEQNERGWHGHLAQYVPFIDGFSTCELIHYDETVQQKYMVELISGIGICD